MPPNARSVLRFLSFKRFASVIAVSLLIHLLVGIFFGGWVIFDRLNPTEPVLKAPPMPQGIEPRKREYRVKMQRSQQQSSAPLPNPIASNIPAELSLDAINLNLTNPRSIAKIRGENDSGSAGKGFGDGFGAGSSFDIDVDLDVDIEFFSAKIKAKDGGKHIVFIIDFSNSMTQGGRESIMRREAVRTIQALPDGIDFAIIFFAGPAWDAFEDIRDDASNWVHTEKGPHTYRPKKWDRLPTIRYGTTSPEDRRRAVRAIQKTPLVYGTVYDVPVYMALDMDPIPDTIFFMTDGSCTEDRGIQSIRKMVEQLQEAGKKVPPIHTVGFGIKGDRQLSAIAQLTNGTTSFLTPNQYIQRYGPATVDLPDDDGFNTKKFIESAPADRYPVEFDLK